MVLPKKDAARFAAIGKRMNAKNLAITRLGQKILKIELSKQKDAKAFFDLFLKYGIPLPESLKEYGSKAYA